jgi:hypothetical protein
MSGPSTSAHLYGGPGNNIFIGGGGVTLMVGGDGIDQFYAGSNRMFSGGNDIGSGAKYFDCGTNGNIVILDFNPAKGDTKASNCKFAITSYSNNIFGGPGLFPGQNLRDFNVNQANNTGVANTDNTT